MKKYELPSSLSKTKEGFMDTTTKDTNLLQQNQFRNFQGKLISECLFDVLNFPKKPTQKFYKFLPKNIRNGQIKR